MKNLITSKEVLYKLISWYQDAKNKYDAEGASNYNAATLATCENNIPNARIVLVKQIDSLGLTFFTNYNSVKSAEIDKNNNAVLVFYWQCLGRQIRVKGSLSRCNLDVSKDYFKSRPLDSQIASLASLQSEELSNYDDLLCKFKALKSKYKDDIPYSSNWGGYTLMPTYVEFWREGENRLHKRTVYSKLNDNSWKQYYLYP